MRASRLIAAIVAASHAVLGMAQPANGFVPARDSHAQVGTLEGCPVLSEPVFDARGYWYQALVQVCSVYSPRELTRGTFASKEGERIYFSQGHTSAFKGGFSNLPPGFLFRALPNQAYGFIDNIPQSYFISMNYPRTGYSWNTVARALPFVPTVVHTLGRDASGNRMMAYSGLKILPSRRADAHPLNEDSVIVALSGLVFRQENSLIAQLAAPWSVPGVRREYAEVVFFQKSEPQILWRRAFIPILLRQDVAQEWLAATSNPDTQWLASSESSAQRVFAVTGTILLAAATFAALGMIDTSSVRSGGGSSASRAEEEYERIRRSNQVSTSSDNRGPSEAGGAPATGSLYEAPNWGGKMPN